ncbi:MAG: hypothetical protein ACRD29_19575 [Acidimicrobiales bacterium]
MRLLRQIVEWGLEEPARQVDVKDSDDRFVGRLDLGWTDHQLGLEYDSERYHNPRHWQRDELRQVRDGELGWEVHRVDKYDLLPGVAWLRELLARRLRRPAA